ncbi:YHS domain-containing (seleno)protein [Paracoccus binzhouensis]|uniref:YHS domain-containing (seleno)protein n=1 Tax=Paracoccus binzhouensis TaxID=2796149 RepID=UPI0018EF17B8|nr:YHS domain-containing (seleno)protein [Paracoccus binzhouensis]
MIRPLLASLLLSLPVPAAVAQDWALDGMDPVSYGTENAAVPGRSDLVTLWRGKAWHFASERNRNLFEANPGAYAPGLGGLCVVALSEGRSEPGNPRYFVVIGQRTYFLRTEQARQRLLADPQHILMRAKAFWTRMNP